MGAEAPSRMSVRIDAQTLGFKAGKNVILHDLSLSILPGELVGILGPSGCGKSTLLRLCSGQLQPTQGRVLLNGRPPGSPELAGAVGFVPQDDVVHGMLRVERELIYAARLRMPAGTAEAAVEKRVREVIDMVELAERRTQRIDRLSGGQRKRVSIGLELLTEPDLLFLDEPTSGLDPALEETMTALFRKIASGGRTVVLTTHIMQSLHRLDMVAVLGAGRLLFFGRPWEASAFFGVSQLQEIYKLLTAQAVPGLAEQFRQSPYFAQYIAARRVP